MQGPRICLPFHYSYQVIVAGLKLSGINVSLSSCFSNVQCCGNVVLIVILTEPLFVLQPNTPSVPPCYSTTLLLRMQMHPACVVLFAPKPVTVIPFPFPSSFFRFHCYSPNPVTLIFSCSLRRYYSRYYCSFHVDLRRRPPYPTVPRIFYYLQFASPIKVFLVCLLSGCLLRHLKKNKLLTWSASIPGLGFWSLVVFISPFSSSPVLSLPTFISSSFLLFDSSSCSLSSGFRSISSSGSLLSFGSAILLIA